MSPVTFLTAGRLSLAAVLAVALAGCMMPPATTVLSRLPENQSGAAVRPLTPEERKRYDAIDQQVLREQDEAMAADALARARSYYAPTPFYGSYYDGNYGGYGYPGWGWGW